MREGEVGAFRRMECILRLHGSDGTNKAGPRAKDHIKELHRPLTLSPKATQCHGQLLIQKRIQKQNDNNP